LHDFEALLEAVEALQHLDLVHGEKADALPAAPIAERVEGVR
jgi:hypothetical protein